MGLSASMWTSVSGLLAHGNKMNVVGNNIANVSTIGFKSQRMDFSDYLYISGGSASGPVQIGAGVNTYAVIGDFSQGTLESTNSVTDLAIDGNGFFKVRQPNSEQMYYTRAGDFFFNADRQLQNPEGYRLQGWRIDNSTRLTFKSDSVNLGTTVANESAFQGTGTPVDIVLDSWYLEPQRTSNVSFTMGLTSDNKSDFSTSTTSPLTALYDQWDATKQPPIADSSYATSSSIKVYDEGGTSHTLTVYYDQVATKATDPDGNVIYEIEGLPAGYTVYEYVVTIPPEEDMRSYGGTGFDEETNEFTGTEPTQFYNDPVKGTNKNAGMLMTGHLIFDTAGNLVNQTAYSYGANADGKPGEQCQLEPDQLSSWQATKFSSNGLPVFCANFTGQALANSVSEVKPDGQSQAQDYLIELDLGLRTRGDWTYAGSLDDLVGDLQYPVVNTPTRVSLAAQTFYQKVNWYDPRDPDDPTKIEEDSPDTKWPEDQFGWKVDSTVDGLDKAFEEDFSKWNKKATIYLETDPGDPETRKEIQYEKPGGPVRVIVNSKTGKQYTEEQAKKLLKSGDLLDEELTYAFLGADGKPVRDKDGNIYKEEPLTYDEPTDPADPADLGELSSDELDIADETFLWARSLKKIPETMLTADYEQLRKDDDGKNKIVDVSLESGDTKTIYAISSGGRKLAVRFNDDGVITGVTSDIDADGVAEDDAEWDDYNGEKIYIDKAISTLTVDYNTAFSTYDDPIRGENSTKAGSASFITQGRSQNGYASGILSGTNITADGVVYGYYDNGETVPLYQIALYDFHNLQGLRREGGNLYAQTKESGEARQGVAGEAGFGNVKAYSIEGSNVDLSREFVNMITTQRGFQANSKGITTVDTMLETVIGMKR